MTTFDYREHTIVTTENGMFRTINKRTGKPLAAPSLKAMKDKIDKVVSFDAFPIILEAYLPKNTDSGEVEWRTATVTSKHGASFVTDRGLRYNQVIRDTPENRAAYLAWKLESERVNKEIQSLRDGAHALYDAIPREKPPQ